MKKLICVLALGVSASAFAQNQPTVNQAAIHTGQTTTVKQALTFKDNHKVQLKGYVTKALGDEKYEFRDKTGHITVDIDDDLWQGKPISPTTPVTILGEVDIDYKPIKRVEIDVEHVNF
ncbi:MAG: NirD/YgiW/YdeI family stress tolerance protein [Acinetobacter sp.]